MLNKLTDFQNEKIEDIVKEARENNNGFAYNYIIKKYEGMIHGIIQNRNFYLRDGEYEDLLQEGKIGLYKAINVYDPNYGAFEMFCKIVISRHLITAIKKSNRLKHKVMNQVCSFDKSLPDNENLTMMDVIGFREEIQNKSDLDTIDPEEKFILEETKRIQQEMLDNSLSKKEKRIHTLHNEDKSYKEIMEILNITNAKEVDNTIQRIKRKFKEVQLLEDKYDDEVDEKKQKIN